MKFYVMLNKMPFSMLFFFLVAIENLSCCGPKTFSEDLSKLLAGDERVEITSVKLVGQGQEITIDDPAALRYLAKSFRNPIKGDEIPIQDHGYTYICYLTFGDGIPLMLDCDAPDGNDGLQIVYPYGHLQRSSYYWIPLHAPPLAVAKMLAQMRTPNQFKDAKRIGNRDKGGK